MLDEVTGMEYVETSPTSAVSPTWSHPSTPSNRTHDKSSFPDLEERCCRNIIRNAKLIKSLKLTELGQEIVSVALQKQPKPQA
jgi:hypothetical protein